MRKARADLSTPSQKQQQQQLKRSNEAPPRSSKRKHANHHHRREEAGASRKRREEAENHRYRDRPTGNRERTINPDKSGGGGSVRRKNWVGRGFGSHATEEGWWCSRRRRGAGPWRGAASARRASAPAPPLPLPHLLRPSRPPRGHHHSTAQAQCESSRDETRRERRW